MKRTRTKKLALAPECIRNLTAEKLSMVPGGLPDPSDAACPTYHSHCNCYPAV